MGTGTRTFSMANSSSALTLISRAFSRASCLMKATYIPKTSGELVFKAHRCARRGAAIDRHKRKRYERGLTILFISLITSSSLSGRVDIVGSLLRVVVRTGGDCVRSDKAQGVTVGVDVAVGR